MTCYQLFTLAVISVHCCLRKTVKTVYLGKLSKLCTSSMQFVTFLLLQPNFPEPCCRWNMVSFGTYLGNPCTLCLPSYDMWAWQMESSIHQAYQPYTWDFDFSTIKLQHQQLYFGDRTRSSGKTSEKLKNIWFCTWSEVHCDLSYVSMICHTWVWCVLGSVMRHTWVWFVVHENDLSHMSMTCHTWVWFVLREYYLSYMSMICCVWIVVHEYGLSYMSMTYKLEYDLSYVSMIYYTWVWFVVHEHDLLYVSMICRTWVWFVKHEYDLSNVSMICQTWVSFVVHEYDLSYISMNFHCISGQFIKSFCLCPSGCPGSTLDYWNPRPVYAISSGSSWPFSSHIIYLWTGKWYVYYV